MLIVLHVVPLIAYNILRDVCILSYSIILDGAQPVTPIMDEELVHVIGQNAILLLS